jgi:transposase InsO family protein
LVLVELSVVEQRYRAVLAVLAGERVTVVARQWGVSRQAVHGWLARYRDEGLAGLADRSHRPHSSPGQASAVVESAVCEVRRLHPGWGPRRIAFVLGRDGCPGPVPSRMTVYRILVRHGLIEPKSRRRRQYRRWQRDAPMALWQMDIVGGLMLADGSECKVVTGVDDHSRYCVIARVVARPTGRAVCLAFAEALHRFGVPEEVLTDNGKQFTDRFGKGGEVLFDRICRDNAITHRLTAPASPTTTGKVERFHGTMRREWLNHADPFADLAAAQAELDAWVADYNTARPHESLDMDSPAQRFRPATAQDVLPLRLPARLREPVTSIPGPVTAPVEPAPPAEPPAVQPPEPVVVWDGGPVEFDRVVPASGNLGVAGKQFWLGPARAGVTVTFWADTDMIHLLIAGGRIKSLRSHLSVNDLAVLAARGGRKAGPSPLPAPEPGPAIEVDRTVTRAGTVALGQHMVLAAEILAGRRVSIRVEPATLHFFDPDTRQLLRTRPNPFTAAEVARLRGARPAGPPPQPPTGPVTVTRRVGGNGTVAVLGQKIALGRAHARATVTIQVTDTTLIIDLGDGATRTIRRTTTLPVRQVKAQRPRKVDHDS